MCHKMNCLSDFEIVFNNTSTGIKVSGRLLKVNVPVQKAGIWKTHTLGPDEKQYPPSVGFYNRI